MIEKYFYKNIAIKSKLVKIFSKDLVTMDTVDCGIHKIMLVSSFAKTLPKMVEHKAKKRGQNEKIKNLNFLVIFSLFCGKIQVSVVVNIYDISICSSKYDVVVQTKRLASFSFYHMLE